MIFLAADAVELVGMKPTGGSATGSQRKRRGSGDHAAWNIRTIPRLIIKGAKFIRQHTGSVWHPPRHQMCQTDFTVPCHNSVHLFWILPFIARLVQPSAPKPAERAGSRFTAPRTSLRP